MVVLTPTPPIPRIHLRGMTAAEFEAFARLPEHGDKMFEYIQGEAWEVVSNGVSSATGALLGACHYRIYQPNCELKS